MTSPSQAEVNEIKYTDSMWSPPMAYNTHFRDIEYRPDAWRRKRREMVGRNRLVPVLETMGLSGDELESELGFILDDLDQRFPHADRDGFEGYIKARIIAVENLKKRRTSNETSFEGQDTLETLKQATAGLDFGKADNDQLPADPEPMPVPEPEPIAAKPANVLAELPEAQVEAVAKRLKSMIVNWIMADVGIDSYYDPELKQLYEGFLAHMGITNLGVAYRDGKSEWQISQDYKTYRTQLPPKRAVKQVFDHVKVTDQAGNQLDPAEELMAKPSKVAAKAHVQPTPTEIVIDVPTKPTQNQHATHELVPVQAPMQLTGDTKWDAMRQQADMMLKSGFLPAAVNTVEKVITIGLMGQALGLSMIVAVNNIDVIQGKPTVKPQLMLALARQSKQLEDFQMNDDGTTCTVVMKRKGEQPYTVTFSMDDAKNMQLTGKDNWRKQPAVMRQWRAISAACRVVFPDVIWGFYTPEELDPDRVISIEEVAS